jgi:hypothetical protein
MFFAREDCPIFLQTDSSDYGIGAYCFQLVDNAEQSVAFVSKTLSATQFKWAIVQKEAYTIFYTLRNLKGILRDRPFTFQTDNRCLRFMRTDTNPMVYRWLVDIQEYDFTQEDILGKDNPVADGFFRLVANNMPSDIIAMLSPPPKIPEQLLILIGKVHSSISGHHDLERTLRILTTHSSPDSTVILVESKTPKLRNYIKQYIATCPCCYLSMHIPSRHHITTLWRL